MLAIAFISFLLLGGVFIAALPTILESRDRIIWLLLAPASAVTWIITAWLATHFTDVLTMICLAVFVGISLVFLAVWSVIVAGSVASAWESFRQPAQPMPVYPASIKTGRKSAVLIVLDAGVVTAVACFIALLFH